MHIQNDDIKLLLFSSESDTHLEKIADAVPDSFPKERIVNCSSMNSFSKVLAKMLYGFSIILIIIRNKDELYTFYQMNDRLKDHSTIIILSDTINDMAQEAIRIYPRYTTFMKDEYSDIAQVLNSMINHMERKIKGENDGRSD